LVVALVVVVVVAAAAAALRCTGAPAACLGPGGAEVVPWDSAAAAAAGTAPRVAAAA